MFESEFTELLYIKKTIGYIINRLSVYNFKFKL